MTGLCKDCRYWSYEECVDLDLDTFNCMKLEGLIECCITQLMMTLDQIVDLRLDLSVGV